jgi:hypothetical protein
MWCHDKPGLPRRDSPFGLTLEDLRDLSLGLSTGEGLRQGRSVEAAATHTAVSDKQDQQKQP